MAITKAILILAVLSPLVPVASAETVFVEAETFTPSSNGWKISGNSQTRPASRVATLHGAGDDPRGTASKMVTLREAGCCRVWVRHIYVRRWRGGFRLSVLKEGKELAGKDFDLEVKPEVKDWDYVWDYVDADLPAGAVELRLSKYQNENSSGYVRHVDCVLLTTDKTLTPDHISHGPQTYLRVTLGGIYTEPVYVHVFADHYRSPWYAHFHLSKGGANPGLAPPKEHLLAGGERTPWCNITPMLYQDSGAILNITVRHTYNKHAPRLKARFEFAAAGDEKSIVRTMDVEAEPNGLVVVAPPDLTTEVNRERLKRDKEFAEATGKVADSFDWPTIGKKPERFPFFVTATIGGYGTPVDKAVADREWKTLDYFGFSNREKTHIGGGVWYMKEKSYCRPDVERIREKTAARAVEFHKTGKTAKDITYCMLMDEPGGQSADFAAGDEAYHEAFRAWLKKLGKTPKDALVSNWDEITPVPDRERDKHPGLHYFTQRFRTQALGDFLATQRKILEEAYGGSFPMLANFSDGATYHANFYSQGVDYFELLDDDGQNAIWGEDWANHSSSYQCGAYNVDLMRAAAHRRGQVIGHYLIAYAGRKPWDIKLKAAGEVARGVKVLTNYFYGVSWGSHSRGWYDRPSVWRANAEIVREIGGAEDLLFPAMPKPAEVAILYSSSADAWTLGENYAYGFNRMHTWMALAHNQIPVDFLSEQDVEAGLLDGYGVCYLSGPNLTRAAAAKLKKWVESGGVLFLTAGAAMRDEFNRSMKILDPVVAADREEAAELQPFRSAGHYLYTLAKNDEVTAGKTKMEVLSVKQSLSQRPGATVLGKFNDGAAAIVRRQAGKGTVYCVGFLPGLDYVKKAEVARRTLSAREKEMEETKTGPSAAEEKCFARFERSRNPWEYPDDVRELILDPVRAAKVKPPLKCSVPLVDAVVMSCERGLVIPLANYTLEPIANVDFTVRPDRPVDRIETVYQGKVNFDRKRDKIVFSIPLDCTDFVKIYYK